MAEKAVQAEQSIQKKKNGYYASKQIIIIYGVTDDSFNASSSII
ncbi:MAG: hypothetical protein ACLT69_06215 [Intestinibacter bartlettii]